MKRPAEIKRAIDSAICAVASVMRKRAADFAPDGCPAFALSADTRFGRVLCRAGNNPKSNPAQGQRCRKHHNLRVELQTEGLGGFDRQQQCDH